MGDPRMRGSDRFTERPLREWVTADGDVFGSREAAVDHLRLVGEPGDLGRLKRVGDAWWESVRL